MLDFMRKRAKTWALRVLLFGVAATFALWGIGGFISEDLSAVMTVDGEKIPLNEYQRTFNRLVDSYRSVMGGGLDSMAIETLKIRESATDFLLERAILKSSAKDLRMTVDSAEVAEFVRKEPAFSDKGTFSRERYRSFLAANNLTEESFEASLANDMTLAKVRSLVRASAVVTPQEIQEVLDMSANKVEVELARIDPDGFTRQAGLVSSEEASAWFADHREDFRRPETFEAAFAVLDPSAYHSRVTVSDDELAALFEEKRAEMNEPSSYRFSRILFPLPLSASAESVGVIRAGADAVAKEIREGKTSFAAAARKHSQDAASAAKGGDMGRQSAGALEPAVISALEAAEKGKVTEPVPTSRGLEILLLAEKTPARDLTLAEARPRLTAEITASKALELANDTANQILSDTVKAGKPLVEAARARGAGVITPPAFTRKTPPPGVIIPREILPEVYRAENREVGDVYEAEGKLYLFQMVKRTDSYLPQFAEARAEAEAVVLVKKALEAAGKEAARMAQEVSAGAPLRAVVGRLKAPVTAPPAFSILSEKVGDLPEGDSIEVVRAAFSIPRRGMAAVAKGKGAWYLVALKATVPGEAGDKEALRDQVAKLLREQRRQQLAKGFFLETREAMKDRIQIRTELL